MNQKESSEIVRWEPSTDWGTPVGTMIESASGKYVLESDHAAHVARLEGLMTEAMNWLKIDKPRESNGFNNFYRRVHEALARPQESEKE